METDEYIKNKIIPLNEEKKYYMTVELIPKGKCGYIFKKDNNILKKIIHNQPVEIKKNHDVWKLIAKYVNYDEKYNNTWVENTIDEDILPTLQEYYEILKAEAEIDNTIDDELLYGKTKAEAEFWDYHIHKFGLVPILDAYLGFVHIGDKTNIYNKLIHGYGVITGVESYYQNTVARAEAGKSYEDDILYNHYNNIGLLPEEYIIMIDNITEAAFRNKGLWDDHCYDKKILYAGDKGEMFDEELMEEMKAIVKKLITDKHYTVEKDDGTNTSNNVNIPLFADSIAWVENTVLNLDKNDKGQRDTRSNNYTIIPEDNRTIMSFESELIGNPDGRISQEYNDAVEKLKTFQSFIRKKTWNHENRKIIIPLYMREYFMDLYDKNSFGRREFKRHLLALRSFYELQTLEGDCVDDATFQEYVDLFINETTMPPLVNRLYLSLKDVLNVPMTVEVFMDKAVQASGLNHKVFDEMSGDFVWQPLSIWLDVQEDKDIQKVLKKLLQLYRLKNRNSAGRYFFTTSDLKDRLSDNKAYKNIDNIAAALETMQSYNLIDCLEEQVKINGRSYRIWYLLPS